MIHRFDIEQGTPEWRELRRGKFTASLIPKLFMGKTTQGYNDAIYKVAMERLGKETEGFISKDMERGTKMEPLARNAYSVETLTVVDECGFIEIDEWLGCSPDGLIGEDGLIQIKCPRYNTHIGYLLDGEIPKDYFLQMQAELWMSGRRWNDFFSFHPELPSVNLRVLPDEKTIARMIEEIEEAKERVLEVMQKIQS